MAFFSRPNLDDVQFKQIGGTQLTLSGQTQIATVSGFTLSDGAGGNVIITASGSSSGTTGYVLAQDVDGIIKLMPSAASGASAYYGSSPTTCAVGGLSAGTTICGMPIQDILETMLAPTLSPSKIEPAVSSFWLTLSPSASTGYYEIGTSLSIIGNTTFSRGSVTPQYCGGPTVRSGLPNGYCYTYCGGNICVSSTSLSNTYSFPAHTIVGTETYTGRVYYNGGSTILNSAGGTAVFTSTCTCTINPLPAGNTSTISRTISATHPWFWGTGSTAPVVGQTLINAAKCKCVALSTSDVVVTNYGVTGQYVWVALPAANTKSKWQGGNSPSNCGTIPGDLFAAGVTCAGITSPDGCGWSASYVFYVSNYPTSINYTMTFKNS